MTPTADLGPAADRMAALLGGIADEQLGAPTPCAGTPLGALVDHVSTLSLAFRAAAAKETGEEDGPPPRADAAHLGADWRTRVPAELDALARAWRDPAAWEGTTRAGGLDLPAAVTGVIALDELVLHGWDVARASGQPFSCSAAELGACLGFVSAMAVPSEAAGREGLFGPVVPVPPDAPLLDRVLGLSGRDPGWRAP